MPVPIINADRLIFQFKSGQFKAGLNLIKELKAGCRIKVPEILEIFNFSEKISGRT